MLAESSRTGEVGKVDSGLPFGGHGSIHVRMDLEVRDKFGIRRGFVTKDYDLTLFQLTQFFQASYLAVNASSIKEIGGTTQAVTGAITSNTPQISFGTGTTAAAYTDFAIQTAAGGTNPVTAASSAATSGANTWTVTATWSNTTGVTVTISELALYVTTTAGVAANKTYALTHDEFTGQAVSAGGTAAATLTFTMS